MWIVRLALRRPYTFVVMALVLLLLTPFVLLRMPTDIFPPTNIPVVSAVWTYNGLRLWAVGPSLALPLFEGILANTRSAAKVLVIDGCKAECARKTRELAGFSGFARLQLERDLHFEKGATRVTAARIRQVADPGADLLAS